MIRLAIALTVGACALGALAPIAGAEGITETKLFYGRGQVDDATPRWRRLRLNLVRPAPDQFPGRRPLVVLLHGGGFTQGSYRDVALTRLARALASNGVASASVEYRVQPSNPIPSARVAALLNAPEWAKSSKDRTLGAASAVDDTLMALDFLREDAPELGLDSRRVGLVGESAGAATANHIAYALDDHSIKRPPIRFVGSLWGAILLGPSGRTRRSPMSQMESGEPPLFLAHGTRDGSVMCPVEASDAMASRARYVGIDVEYLRLAGRRHGFTGSGFFRPGPAGGPSVMDQLVQFAVEKLRPSTGKTGQGPGGVSAGGRAGS